ncbi:hypothetical protein DAEQUDRAFT_540035 [Daedalea quercina L-15889]|uniref:Uncharacterized protein n=1 Tax=Daedalea quercina L-15889 TaxID=1314783 RepID=A0A165M3H1_9APHY|nr:hypothetical protein DAEQUDRAFT_540035 [Daedalea quercina L-15889]
MSSPGRTSTSRLRSKTSDLSDFLRGGRNDQRQLESDLLPLPPHPDTQPETPSKGKHKISFFGRKRKSSFVSPVAAKPAESRVQRDSEVPPLPQISTDKQSTRYPAGPSSPPSSPSSPTLYTNPPSTLPPLDVSPPSFGPLSQFIHSKSIRRLSGGHAEYKAKAGSSIPVPAVHRLRPQKSTSFEHTRRSDESQSTLPGRPTGIPARKGPSHSRKNSGGRPTITVSAPPPDADDSRQSDITPRASRLPRSGPSLPPQGPLRSPRRRAQEAPETPSSDDSRPPSPQLPMYFPVPPGPLAAGAEEASSGAGLELASRRSSVSASSVSSTRGVRTFSILKSKSSRDRLPQKRASAVPAQDAHVAADVVSDDDGSKSAPEPSSRTALPYRPAPSSTSLARSDTLAGTGPASDVRTSSTSPGPPTDPLPSPPPSAPASVRSINRVTSDEYQSDSGASLSTMPTIPSVASTRMSVGQVHQILFRHRTGTVTSLASTSTGSGTLASTGSGPSTGDTERASSNPPSPLREQFLSENRTVPRPRARMSVQEGTEEPQIGAQLTTVEQLREALQAQSAKYQRLSTYLLTLSERHAVEKNELIRRIETLEKDARRREREITGLRWLVMNASPGNGIAATNGNGAAAKEGQSPTKPSPVMKLRERMRSVSVSNAQGSHRGGRKVGTPPEWALSTDSQGDGSIEEGLLETQQSISDLIAPLQPSPPTSDAVASPVPVSRMRRANTWSLPEAMNRHAISAAQQRRPRRTSSPTLPGSVTGLGISVGDLPSIPSLPESELGHDMSPMTSPSETVVSIPSLTAADSASSGLSAIPEAPATPVRASMEKGMPDVPKEKDLNGRRLRRESAVMGSPHIPGRHTSSPSISSSSPASASAAYAGNLEMGASPSIGQVLDRVSMTDSDHGSEKRQPK